MGQNVKAQKNFMYNRIKVHEKEDFYLKILKNMVPTIEIKINFI